MNRLCLSNSFASFGIFSIFGSFRIFRIAVLFGTPNFACCWLTVVLFLALLLRLLLLLIPILVILVRILILIILALATRISTTRPLLLPMLILRHSEILAGVQSTISLLINYNIGCFRNTGTPIGIVYRLYATAHICLISRFNTNATISCMSVPTQLRSLALLLLLFQKFPMSITITLLLVFMLGSVLPNFNKLPIWTVVPKQWL